VKLKPQIIAEAAIALALATVLSFVKVFEMPMGGSVTAGSMVPLLIFSLRRGYRIGLITTLLYCIVQFLVEPVAVSPIQVLLDYPFAFGLLGIAGLFQEKPLWGVIFGITGRFFGHFISGAIFFAQYAPEGMNPWTYSAIYNGSYLLPELIVSAILIYILFRKGILEIYK